MKKSLLATATVIALATVGHARATIVNNSNGTFTDTASGLIWEDVSTYYDETSAQVATSFTGAEAFATTSQMGQLEIDTGLTITTTDPTFSLVAAAMGAPQPAPDGAELIWGFYGDGTEDAFIYGPINPVYEDNWTNAYNGGYPGADEGAFVVVGSVAAPEPASLALLATGFAVVGGFRRHRRN